MPSEPLNTDVIARILDYADRQSIKNVSLCSTTCREIALPLLFRRLDFALESSARIRSDVSVKTLLLVKEIHLRINETSKAIHHQGEPEDGGLGGPAHVEALAIHRHYPIRQRSYQAYKDILSTCTGLSSMSYEASGGRADWSGTEYSPRFYAWAVAKCLGACHVILPDVPISLHLSPSHWLSTTVNCLNTLTRNRLRMVELSLWDTMVGFNQLQDISTMPQLETLRIDYCDVRDAVDWVPSGFVALKKLRLSYQGIAGDDVRLSVYRKLMGFLANQLEEFQAWGPRAMVEGPTWDPCQDLESMPKLRNLAATRNTISELLIKHALPVIRHIEVKHAREPVSIIPDFTIFKRALREYAPATLQTVHVETCSPARLEWLCLLSPALEFTVARLQVAGAAECTQLALVRSTQLVFEKGIAAADLEGQTRFTSYTLETVEFADERKENQLFLNRLYAPDLKNVFVRDDFEY